MAKFEVIIRPAPHAMDRARALSFFDMNEIESQAEYCWNHKYTLKEREELLKTATYSTKYAGMPFKHLTPSLKEIMRYCITYP